MEEKKPLTFSISNATGELDDGVCHYSFVQKYWLKKNVKKIYLFLIIFMVMIKQLQVLQSQ